jgi:DNA repair protein RecN (Recombination protein N)
VVDALGLLLGGRASPEMVRTGADRAAHPGIFEIAESPGDQTLEAPGSRWRSRKLLVEREIRLAAVRGFVLIAPLPRFF